MDKEQLRVYYKQYMDGNTNGGEFWDALAEFFDDKK